MWGNNQKEKKFPIHPRHEKKRDTNYKHKNSLFSPSFLLFLLLCSCCYFILNKKEEEEAVGTKQKIALW